MPCFVWAWGEEAEAGCPQVQRRLERFLQPKREPTAVADT